MRSRRFWIGAIFIVGLACPSCGNGEPRETIPAATRAAMARVLAPDNPGPLVPHSAYVPKPRITDLLFHETHLRDDGPDSTEGWVRTDLLDERSLAHLQAASPFSPTVVRLLGGAPGLFFEGDGHLPNGCRIPVGRIDGDFRVRLRSRVTRVDQWNSALTLTFTQDEVSGETGEGGRRGDAELRFQVSLGGGGDGRQGGYDHSVNVSLGESPILDVRLGEWGWMTGRSYDWIATVHDDGEGWTVTASIRDPLTGRVVAGPSRRRFLPAALARRRMWSFRKTSRNNGPTLHGVIERLWLETEHPLEERFVDGSPEETWARFGRWARGEFAPRDAAWTDEVDEAHLDELAGLAWARLRWKAEDEVTLPVVKAVVVLLADLLEEEDRAWKRRATPSGRGWETNPKVVRLLAWVEKLFPRLRRRIVEDRGWKDEDLAKALRRLASFFPDLRYPRVCSGYDMEDLARVLSGR